MLQYLSSILHFIMIRQTKKLTEKGKRRDMERKSLGMDGEGR
jgi:hypothetical protein